ncbi:MAG: sodium/proline symporter PutP [Oscillospiraceae bacterium]|nr:sodium/proline symporter PutP [Oscillospiraceae bacterium]
MTTSTIIVLITMIVYLGGMVAIGIAYNRRSKGGSAEFFLGGRQLSPLVTAMSAEASDMSSYLLMGLPGLALLCGLAEVSWTVIGLAVGTYLNFLLVARRLRRYSAGIGAITIPDYFTRRFHDKRAVLSLVSALVIVIFFVPYTASGFSAVGKLFSSLFGWDYHLAMIIGAVVIVTYTVLGGFMAVSTTDLIQSIVMTVALLVIVVFGIRTAGGWSNVVQNAQALPGYLDLTKGYIPETGTAGTFGFVPIVSTLAWGLGYFGMPHILLRFMAIRNESEVKTSRRIASIWVVISMAVAVLIGVIGYSVVKELSIDLQDSETIVVELAKLMSKHSALLAVVGGVVLSGILAATMSTADSQLLAASSSVSKDLLQDFFHIKIGEKAAIVTARVTVVLIAVVALFLAWNPDSSVFRVVSFAWGGFGGAFGPIILFSLFWKRTNKWGAFAGMLAGGATIFIWKFLVRPLGGVVDVYELLPAFIVSCIAIVVVSLLTKAPDQEICDEFDKYAKIK